MTSGSKEIHFKQFPHRNTPFSVSATASRFGWSACGARLGKNILVAVVVLLSCLLSLRLCLSFTILPPLLLLLLHFARQCFYFGHLVILLVSLFLRDLVPYSESPTAEISIGLTAEKEHRNLQTSCKLFTPFRVE